MCVNTIRFLSVDMVEKANSGHPGLPMGAAPMAYVLWTRILRHSPSNPRWWDRDRFVLSAGHGSALLYSLLHLTGYDLSLEQIKRFRQWGSQTPGHPESHLTAGVEASTAHSGRASATGSGWPSRKPISRRDTISRTRDLHALHLRPRQRRRHDGGSAERSGIARRTPRPRTAHRPTTTTTSRSRPRRRFAFSEDVSARFRCDANGTRWASQVAIEEHARPTALILTRQAVPTLDRSVHAPAGMLRHSAYVLAARKLLNARLPFTSESLRAGRSRRANSST